jgi:isopenicillin-N N-acyltransferase-like protein
MTNLETKFPLIKVQGSNYEMGYQHGEKCSHKIKDHINVAKKLLEKRGVNEKTAYKFANNFMDYGAAYAPHLVEELNGIADGAKVPREAIYVLNTGIPKESASCTTFTVFGEKTEKGSTIMVQNIDNNLDSRTDERGIILQATPDKGPSLLMFCRAGGLYPHGINSEGGLRIGNALSSILDRQLGTPLNFINRMFLEQTTIEDATEVIRCSNRAVSNANIMSDSSGRVAMIEWCPERLAVIEPFSNIPNRGYFFHTNHFLHPDLKKFEARKGNTALNTVKRLERITELFLEWEKTGEKFSLEIAKRFLSDHANSPHSICQHPAPNKNLRTFACVIAQPDKKTIHVCKGNPCEGEFHTYKIS